MPETTLDRVALGRLYHFPNGARVRTDRVLHQAIGPITSFACHGCVQWYYGDPPVLIVRYADAELRFCTDGCALDEGFATAVEGRWQAEFEGDEFPFVWVDERYQEVTDLEELFDAAG